MNKLLVILVCAFALSSNVTLGQGMCFYTGISIHKNQSPILTPEGTANTGHLIGADGRIGDEGFHFIISLQYHRLNFDASENYQWRATDPTIQYLKGRGGFAFKIFNIGKKIKTKFRVLGSIDYLLNAPDLQNNDLPTNHVFNDAVAGVVGGLEIDFDFITLQVDYEKGFLRALNQTDETSFNSWTTTLGFNF